MAYVGNQTNRVNRRDIVLVSVPEKVYSRTLLWRIDKLLREEEVGFRSGRSCTDQIFILRVGCVFSKFLSPAAATVLAQ